MKKTVFFLSLALLCIENVVAQPTDKRTFEQIERDLQLQITEASQLINNNQLNPVLYQRRARLYQELYRLTQYYGKGHNETYAQKGLADFSRVVELNRSEESFADRAGFYVWIWRTQKPPDSDPVKRLAFFLKNPNFDGAKIDYINAIRLSTSEVKLREYSLSLSDLHLSRGASLAEALTLLDQRNQPEIAWVWTDFDSAIDYAKKALEHAEKAMEHGGDAAYWTKVSRGNVANAYQHKATAAYSLGQYKIALEAYQSGEKYLDESQLEFCNYYADWGRVYLKLNLFDQAIEKFKSVLKPSEAKCPYVFALRGEAYGAKGNLRKAVEDYTIGLEKYPTRVRTEPLLLKRAQIYLKMGDGEKALADLNDYIQKNPGLHCPQPFLLRAQARRQLGQIDLALTDEQAAKLASESASPSSKACVEY